MPACKRSYHGHHSHHHPPPPPPPGTLEIFNSASSGASVVGVDTLAVWSGHVVSKDVVVPPGTGTFFDLAPGTYEVTVHWEDGSRDRFFNIEIWSHKTTSLEVRF